MTSPKSAALRNRNEEQTNKYLENIEQHFQQKKKKEERKKKENKQNHLFLKWSYISSVVQEGDYKPL